MLLEPQLLERLERLALRSRERTAGLFPGEHRSKRMGTSLDFADWRPYVQGDDFRRIDYQIYARLDRLLIRLYESEDELSVRIVLDASASMSFDFKFDMAARLAGALSYLAALRRDRARVWMAGDGRLTPGPWARSRDSALMACDWIERHEPSGTNDLASAITRLSAGGGLTGLTIVLSDLLTEDWEQTLKKLGGAANAALIHVLSRSELEPDLSGDVMLVDSEAGSKVDVSISAPVLKQYRERAAAFVTAVSETCRRRNIAYALVHPDLQIEELLLVTLRREGIVR